MNVPDFKVAATDSHSESVLLLTDFTAYSPDLGWRVVNDNVMGGRSNGGFEIEQGELRFTGNTNTNGGGFSSIRTKPLDLDLSNHLGIQLYVRGDGRRYTWRLTTDARWRGRQVSYWADFETSDGTWGTVNVPFTNFMPRYRGSQLDGPPLDPGQIKDMGLMIYDRKDGPFELHLARVSAMAGESPFTLKQYQWKNRVLVVSAPTEGDNDLTEQLDAVALTQADFAERGLVLVVLLDDEVSMAGNRELTTHEVDAVRSALEIRSGSFAIRLVGKDGAVKLSSESAVMMTEIYALIDSMPMRQREAPSRSTSRQHAK